MLRYNLLFGEDTRRAHQELLDTVEANESLQLFTYFQGVPIISTSKPTRIDSSAIVLSVSEMHLRALLQESFSCIRSSHGMSKVEQFTVDAPGRSVKIHEITAMQLLPERRSAPRVHLLKPLNVIIAIGAIPKISGFLKIFSTSGCMVETVLRVPTTESSGSVLLKMFDPLQNATLSVVFQARIIDIKQRGMSTHVFFEFLATPEDRLHLERFSEHFQLQSLTPLLQIL